MTTETVQKDLINLGVSSESFENGTVRLYSLIYMFYWINRLKNNKEEKEKVINYLFEYLKLEKVDKNQILDYVYNRERMSFFETYVLFEMSPINSVDLVIEKKSEESTEKEVLLYKRDIFPRGFALPGGIVNDEDESNKLNIDSRVYAALRIAAEKVLNLKEEDKIYEIKNIDNDEQYIVSNKERTRSILIHNNDKYGYKFNENIKTVIRPSDPRAIANTIGFKCELIDNSDSEYDKSYVWLSKADLLKPEKVELSFNHHKEIIFHILAKSSLEQEISFLEEDFIRNIINNPLENFLKFKERFAKNNNNPNTSFPELFTIVNKILKKLFNEKINEQCQNSLLLNGMRDKVVINLRHVSLKNRTFCPYLPTIKAIFEAIAFFDIIARDTRSFYDGLPTDAIIEHNPREKPFASYHMYRYKYRLDDMLSMVPEEIIIPTFASLSATDLMKIRGIPVRFVGLSTDFLYVDEFEQSPEEFLMHDCNHSWRMIHEDNEACKELGISKDELIEQSNVFISEYLGSIKIKKEDSEYEKEIKKIKKIILFEIVHEDARPFLKDIIGKYIQIKEGGEVRFEVPRIDPETGYMDVVDTLDTGISTLSYVRNKLQHGFYDQVDSQLPQIVSPKYRKSKYIADAAFQMLRELNPKATELADLAEDGLPSYEWILRRVCSVGPDNIHEVNEVDEILAEYSDGVEKLNPKRYQV